MKTTGMKTFNLPTDGGILRIPISGKGSKMDASVKEFYDKNKNGLFIEVLHGQDPKTIWSLEDFIVNEYAESVFLLKDILTGRIEEFLPGTVWSFMRIATVKELVEWRLKNNL